MTEKQNMALEAMLDPAPFEAKIKELQKTVEDGKRMRWFLQRDYNIQDEYIQAALEGEEFKIHVERSRNRPHQEIFIAAKDGVIKASRIHEDGGPRRFLHLEETKLDLKNKTKQYWQSECSDEQLKKFYELCNQEGVLETIPGLVVDLTQEKKRKKLNDFIEMKEWFNSEPVADFWMKREGGWYAILEFRNPKRIELAQVDFYERHAPGAKKCHGAEAMSCVLPWFIDLYNKTFSEYKHCKTEDTESMLKSMKDIIIGIEDGNLNIPDFRTK